MKVSKKSLSYKFLSWALKEVPNNLCDYFWSVIGCSLTLVAATFMIGIASIFMLAPLIYLTIPTTLRIQDIYAPLFMDGVLIVVLGFILIKEKLLYNYIKAMKKKYCPKLTFTEK